MSAAWGIFTRSVSPTWTFSSFCSDSLITMALKGCLSVFSRRGAALPAQKVKKFSGTPRMFTLDARVCVCGATTVPFSKITETVLLSVQDIWRKKAVSEKGMLDCAESFLCYTPQASSHRIPDNQCPCEHTRRHSCAKRDDEMYLPKIFEGTPRKSAHSLFTGYRLSAVSS